MFRKMPFILLLIMAGIVLLDPLLPLSFKQTLYGVSLSIKSFIIFILPLVIFGLLLKATMSLSANATRIISFLLVGVCLSSLMVLVLSYGIGGWVYHFNLALLAPQEGGGLQPAWVVDFPKLIANDKAMASGIILGLLAPHIHKKSAHFVATHLNHFIEIILSLFIYLVPVFIAGFFMKLYVDGAIVMIIKDYALIFAVIAASQAIYIGLVYYALSGRTLARWKQMLRHMAPAALSGFSTMSSAASMPLTLIGASSNAKHKDLVRSIIPATVNIHLVGDCFATPILAYAVMKNFGHAAPDLAHYAMFVFYFIVAKFSVAGVPGGGIIVMLPILEAYLGFDSPMLSLITALYILFDPVITCTNVLGNGAFAVFMDKIALRLGHR